MMKTENVQKNWISKIFIKTQKLKKYPLQPQKTKKTKNELSSDLMMKMQNVMTQKDRKQSFL